MFRKKSLLPVIFAVIAVNAAGSALKLFDLPAFIILLGFRFHIALILPFIFIASALRAEVVKKEFLDPMYKKNSPYVISLFLLPAVVFFASYLVEYIILGDPEYFFEFGLSSVVDLPIYLVWNSVQIIAFYFYLLYASESTQSGSVTVFFAALLPFAFEFYPWDSGTPAIPEIAAMVIFIAAVTLIVIRFRNIYWFTIFIYLSIWQYILLFGSKTDSVIKMFFASQYNSWEGFFKKSKTIDDYSLPVYILSVILVLFIYSLFRKKEKIIS